MKIKTEHLETVLLSGEILGNLEKLSISKTPSLVWSSCLTASKQTVSVRVDKNRRADQTSF